MQNYDPYRSHTTFGGSQQMAATHTDRALMTQVFAWLGGALAITTIGVMLASTIPASDLSGLWIVGAIASLGLCFATQMQLHRGNIMAGSVLFILFALAEGFLIGPLVLAYLAVAPTEVAAALVGTVGVFFLAAAIVWSTNFITPVWGRFLFGALLVGIVGLILSMFVSGIYVLVLGVLGVVFVGLTMFDFWRLKNMATRSGAVTASTSRGRSSFLAMNASRLYAGSAIMIAMALYLDFINLFLIILQLLGASRGGMRR